MCVVGVGVVEKNETQKQARLQSSFACSELVQLDRAAQIGDFIFTSGSH